MKKILIIIASIAVILCLAAGGIFLYITSTPEYALAKTIADVNTDGLNGLKKHMTEHAVEEVETIEDLIDTAGVSDALSSTLSRYAVSFLKSKLSETDWTIDDVLKGNNRADVIIHFNYADRIVGTIGITMVRVEREWKIDGLSFPQFEKVSLW